MAAQQETPSAADMSLDDWMGQIRQHKLKPTTTNAQRILRSASYAVKAAGPVAALVTLIKLSKMVARAATSLPSFSVRYGVRQGVEEDEVDEEDSNNFATSFGRWRMRRIVTILLLVLGR